MAKKTLKCGMTFSVSPEVKAWWDAKRQKGFNLSAIFEQIMLEAIAREARTGDWLAKDVPSMRVCGGVIEAQWGADEAKEILGIDDDE